MSKYIEDLTDEELKKLERVCSGKALTQYYLDTKKGDSNIQFQKLIWKTNYYGKDLFKFREAYKRDNLSMEENGLNFVFTGLTLDYLVDLTEDGIEKWKKENENKFEVIDYGRNKYNYATGKFNVKPISIDFELNGLKVNAKIVNYIDELYKCPFSIFENEEFIKGYKLYELTNTKNNRKIKFSNIVSHMIQQHHFFGGKNSDNRLEPKEFSDFLD
ncbi:hypothetical protein GW932_00475 [archaeon]|nr:hypothetical protein [archaeon]